ncbi:hypothetical protein ACED29_00720 [Shewanella sp. 5S214]|uniref:hypothetical protein n=1 Tax=Shewanella sp. 5S214 TaxID=3229999 RepID=UPI00352D608A
MSSSEGVRVKVEMLCENSKRADKPNTAMCFRRVNPSTYDLLEEFKEKSHHLPAVITVISRKRRLNN